MIKKVHAHVSTHAHSYIQETCTSRLFLKLEIRGWSTRLYTLVLHMLKLADFTLICNVW